jgi:hypothetical protein
MCVERQLEARNVEEDAISHARFGSLRDLKFEDEETLKLSTQDLQSKRCERREPTPEL